MIDEKEFERAIRDESGDIRRVSTRLGVSRQTVYVLIAHYGFEGKVALARQHKEKVVVQRTLKAIEKARGLMPAAAELLNLNVRTLERRVVELGIKADVEKIRAINADYLEQRRTQARRLGGKNSHASD